MSLTATHSSVQLHQLARFAKALKKLHANEKREIYDAIAQIVQDPGIGTSKRGDLSGTQVYKFRMQNQLCLLAYDVDEIAKEITLIAFGPHENFYRDLKRD